MSFKAYFKPIPVNPEYVEALIRAYVFGEPTEALIQLLSEIEIDGESALSIAENSRRMAPKEPG